MKYFAYPYLNLKSNMFGITGSLIFTHIHKKEHRLETSTRLMFMLLEHFFTSARPRRVRKKKLLPKSAVNYSRYLRLNNIIAQMKTCTSYKKKISLLILDVLVKIFLYIANTIEYEVFTVHINHISWQIEGVRFSSKMVPTTLSPLLNIKKPSAPILSSCNVPRLSHF